MANNQLTKKIGSAAKWSSLTEVLAKIIVPLTNMILARLLVPEAFGVIATVTMIISFVDMFSNAGFQKYLIQKDFKNDQERDQSANVAFWANLFISLFMWVLIIIFKDPLATIVGNPGLGNVIAIACIQLPLTSFSSIQIALYRREFNFKPLFIVRMIVVAIPFVITIPLALLGYGYWSLIIGLITGALVNAVILTIKSVWKPSLFFKFSVLKKMLSFSTWILLESTAIWLAAWVDIFIIGTAFTEYYLGLYKNSLNMVNSLMAVVSASILPVLFSTLSRLQNDDIKFQNMYYKMQRYSAYILFPMGAGLFLYSDLATLIMFGEKWIEASDIVGIFALTSVIGIIFSNFNGEVYRAKGKPRLSFIYQLIHLFFLVPVCLIAVNYGFWVLVYARALVRLQGTITGFIFMKIFMKFSFTMMIRNVVKPAFCTMIMITTAVILQFSSDSVGWSIISILICILIYSIALLLIARKDLKGIGKVLEHKKNKKKTLNTNLS